jgi:hypothetical protein
VLETAFYHEDVLFVGNEEGEDGEGESGFIGKFLVSDAGRQQALTALQEEEKAIRTVRGDENFSFR